MPSTLQRIFGIGLLLCVTRPEALLAQLPVLVKDLSPGTSFYSVAPLRLVPLSTAALVSTKSAGLWRYDDSGSLTCVRDTVYADAGETFRMDDGTLLFSGHDGAPSGTELWRTDGTTAGTRLVRDLHTGGPDSYAYGFVALTDGTVLFKAITDAGDEIWRTDGTADGTFLVRDLAPDGTEQYPGGLVSAGRRAFFVYQGKLGVTDGTFEGTSVTSIPIEGGLTTHGGKALFGRSAGGAVELWESDGTEGGSGKVAGLGTATYSPHGFCALGGLTYFFVGTGEKQSLWKTDGTAGGTQLVTTIEAPSYLERAIAAGNLLYFQARTAVAGNELWRSDGTAAGTFMVADLYPGEPSSTISELTPTGAAAVPLLFVADGRLFRTDGTVAGTQKALLLGTGSLKSFAVVGARVLVVQAAVEPQVVRYDLTFRDPAPMPPVTLPSEGLPGAAVPLGAVGGRVIVPAFDPETRRIRLWSTDGTAAGTKLLAGSAGQDLPSAGQFARLGDVGFFVGDGRLVRTDGQNAEPVVDAGVHLRVDALLATSRGRLFFRGGLSSEPNTLWATDGTSTGTQELGKVFPWGAATDVGGAILFAGSATSADLGIWRSDGSTPGTFRVWSGYAGSGRQLEIQAAAVHGLGFFNVPTTYSSWELVRSDGTEAGTSTLPGGSYPYDLTSSAGRLFFTASSVGIADGELWTSDGTPSGTHRLKDIQPGRAGSEPYSLVDAYGTLFFTAADSAGYELWRSDGTEAGTLRVKDIAAGASSSFPSEMYVADGLLFFSADDGIHGRELWVSDGTEEGTHLVADIEEGVSSSYPLGLLAEGGALYFSASNRVVGRELWRLQLPTGARVARSPGRTVTRRPARP